MPPTQRPTRATPRALTLAALGLALLVTGCGGDADVVQPSPSSSPSGDPSATATDEPTGTPSAADGAVVPGTGFEDDYLPVPSGVTLTRPGTRLGLGDDAVGAWLPRQDLVGVVEVAVTRIEETTVQASLAGFDLDAEEQRSTPYFVTATATNVGDTDLGARTLPIYFLDDRGVIVAPTGVAPDFEACPRSTLPGVFAPGDSARSCLIFLVAEGATLQSVMFRPPEGVAPLTWRGRATPLGKRAGRGDRPDDRPDDRPGRRDRAGRG